MKKSSQKIRNSLIFGSITYIILSCIFLLVKGPLHPWIIIRSFIAVIFFDGLLIGIYAPFSLKKIGNYNTYIYGFVGIIASFLFIKNYNQLFWIADDWIGLKILMSIMCILVIPASFIFFFAGVNLLGSGIGRIFGRKIQNDYVEQEEIDALEKKTHKREKNQGRLSIFDIDYKNPYKLIPPKEKSKRQ